jgi:hypothetical protein
MSGAEPIHRKLNRGRKRRDHATQRARLCEVSVKELEREGRQIPFYQQLLERNDVGK